MLGNMQNMAVLRRQLRADFEIPLLLFLLSAVIGTGIAYDLGQALPRLAFIAAGLTLAVGVAYFPGLLSVRAFSHQIRPLHLLLGALPTTLALYFLLLYARDGLWARSHLPEAVLAYQAWLRVPINTPDADVVGGLIAAFLPLQIHALSGAFRASTRARLASIAAIAVSVSAVGLSESHGAWIALPIVMAIWFVWTYASPSKRGEHYVASQRAARWLWLGSGATLILIFAAVLASASTRELLLGLRPDRAAIWRNSLDLASDYPVTGIGLGGFAMAYASYVALVHVPYYYFAYNVFLDLHLQQGLAGLFVFVSWIVVAVRPGGSRSDWARAARAALGISVLLGLVDDPFFGGGGEGAALLFLPFGLLARDRRIESGGETPKQANAQRRIGGRAMALSVLAVGLTVAFMPSVRAELLANAGTLTQTRGELAVFRWPQYAIQDELRLTRKVDVDTPVAYYQAALKIDPANATANRRLGQIELSLGDYEDALAHLLAAWGAGSHQRAIHQMLVEAYAVSGRVGEATAFLDAADDDIGQLGLRQWWYNDYLRDTVRAGHLAHAASGQR